MELLTHTQKRIIDNAWQFPEKYKRVLCLCSVGILRSPTIARMLSIEYNYNTRAAGIHPDALIKVNEALLLWADEIVLAEEEIYNGLIKLLKDNNFSEEFINLIKSKIVQLEIPDIFGFREPELVHYAIKEYSEKKDNKGS